MPIISRLKRLLRADVHAVLDLVEEPEATLKQAMREMEEALDLKRSQLAKTQKTIEGLRSGSGGLEKELTAAADDLLLCLKEGSEELARKTIARKLSLQKRKRFLEQRLEKLDKLREELARELDFQQGQLESIQEKARIFTTAEPEDSPFAVAESILHKSETSARSDPPVSDEEVELEWMRIRGASPETRAQDESSRPKEES